MTFWTLYIDIRQEMHFNLYHTVALTILAAAALDIETKTPCFVTANISLGSIGKQFANLRKHTRISCWIRTRRAAYRRLINDDSFI